MTYYRDNPTFYSWHEIQILTIVLIYEFSFKKKNRVSGSRSAAQ